MRNLKRKVSEKRFLAVLLALATASTTLGLPQAYATDYWDGKWWSNISHPCEMKTVNGDAMVPYWLSYTELDNLDFVDAGDPSDQAEDAINDASNDWNNLSSAWGLAHDNNQTTCWDHKIGSANLASGVLGVTTTTWHFDNHLTRATTNINNDGTNDAKWDYLGETQTGTPDTYDLRKLMLHEFGHWVSFCDTYSGNDCNLPVDDDTIMYEYEFGSHDSLFTHDEDSVVTIYGG